MFNQYDQNGGQPPPPQRQVNQYQGIAFIAACLATMVLGPMAADWTEPYVQKLFLDLYGPNMAGFLTTVWSIGIYALVWFIAQAYIYIAVLFIASYAGTRLLPAML